MKRRAFIKNISIWSLFCPYCKITKKEDKMTETILKPQRLKKGDTIGIISPGSFVKEQQLEKSIQTIKSLGFEPYYLSSILDKHGSFAGTDANRISELHHMFSNAQVAGIICARGGYGGIRLLPDIDYSLIKNNPKALIGFSDVTALLQTIYQQTGLIGFHGPMGISTFSDYTKYNFQKILMYPEDDFTIKISEINAAEDDLIYRSKTIIPGIAEGEIIGGNLSVLCSMIGTTYDFDTTGKILILEEVAEEPYRIDKMLTQLLLSGKLQKAAGIALGIFRKCEAEEPRNSFHVLEIVHERLNRLNVPVVYGLSFGHIRQNATLPIGLKVKLDTEKHTITLTEKAVL